MSKSISFALISVLLLCCLNSRTQSTIHGKVHNATGTPVAFANVLLLAAKDSILVKGVMTSEEGVYVFSNIPAGTYLITSTFVGFKPSYTHAFSIKSNNDNINLDNI